MARFFRLVTCLLLLLAAVCPLPRSVQAQNFDVTERSVRTAINKGKDYLLRQQVKNGANPGSWYSLEHSDYPTGCTSLAVLSLLSTGMTANDAPIQDALDYLRKVRQPESTYELSLMIMALATAKDGKRDIPKLIGLVNSLSAKQTTSNAEFSGGWSYGTALQANMADRSNSQFAILALREAAYAGVPIDRKVWERSRAYWFDQQCADGGWNYAGRALSGSRGSMTVAGITSVVIIDSILKDPDDLNPDGSLKCCGDPQPNKSLNRGIRWLEQNFSVGHNPGSGGNLLYFLYGLERAGRLSGRRFFDNHDWYREGAEVLLRMQNRLDGSWTGVGHGETDQMVGTCFALLFLSKGLAPVLINKLEYETVPLPNAPADDEPWNRHRDDIRNLTDLITGLEGWPKLVTWQQLNLRKVSEHGGLADLLISPILFMNGDSAPDLNDAEVQLLRDYVLNGGFILAEASCTRTEFDRGFRELVKRMYPDGDHELKRLGGDHPVYRSEYLVDPDTVELWGIDVGCRTSIMYSPNDLSCLWDKWNVVDPPRRTPQVKGMIAKATKVGVNIVAYAVGREPPTPLDERALVNTAPKISIDRGLLQIAKLRHPGGWDVAPRALLNLQNALNTYAGAVAATKDKNLTAVDDSLFEYPLLFMHGRNQFQLSQAERDKLKTYFANGGTLFADACCGAEPFDRSFRQLMKELYPDQKLERIPPDNELFSNAIGHDLHQIRRREPSVVNDGVASKPNIVVGEPVLEGIKIDDRYVVIYSKYDISCALERQASSACIGYLPEDAVKVAVNIVLYSILQK